MIVENRHRHSGFFIKFEVVTALYRLPLIAIILLHCSLCGASDDWIRVKLDDFASVEFPMIPEKLDGDDEIMLACADTFGYFTAVVNDFVEAERRDTGKAGLVTFYRGLADRKLDFDNGQLLKMKEFEYLETTGLEFSYLVNQRDSLSMGKFVRLWLNNGRIYSLEVWYDAYSSVGINEFKERFFSSFEYEKSPTSFSPESITAMISESFIALIIGFVGILVMVLFIIRRRGRRG